MSRTIRFSRKQLASLLVAATLSAAPVMAKSTDARPNPEVDEVTYQIPDGPTWEQYEIDELLEKSGAPTLHLDFTQNGEPLAGRLIFSLTNLSDAPLSQKEFDDYEHLINVIETRAPNDKDQADLENLDRRLGGNPEAVPAADRPRFLTLKARALSGLSRALDVIPESSGLKAKLAGALAKKLDQEAKLLTNSKGKGLNVYANLGLSMGGYTEKLMRKLTFGKVGAINSTLVISGGLNVVNTVDKNGKPVSFLQLNVTGGVVSKVQGLALPGIFATLAHNEVHVENPNSLFGSNTLIGALKREKVTATVKGVYYGTTGAQAQGKDVESTTKEIILVNPLNPIDWLGAGTSFYETKGHKVSVMINVGQYPARIARLVGRAAALVMRNRINKYLEPSQASAQVIDASAIESKAIPSGVASGLACETVLMGAGK